MDIIEQAFQSADNPMALVLDGVFVRANKALVDYSGLKKEEIIGRPFTDFVVDKEMIRELHMKRLMGQDVPSLYQLEVNSKDGVVTANILISKITVNESVGVLVVLEVP